MQATGAPNSMNLAAAHPATGAVSPARSLPLLTLLLGALLSMMSASISSVALPTISADLNASGLQLHLIASGYAVTLTATVLIAGAISDAYGRKRVFLLGLLLLASTSLFASRADGANELIVWRFLSGIAASMVLPATLSAVNDLFPDPARHRRAVGLWAGVTAAGSALAPAVAGLLLSEFRWGAVFLVTTPLAVLALLIGWRVLPPMRPVADTPAPDWAGGVLAAAALSGLLIAVILFPVEGWSMPTRVFLLLTILGLVGFVIRERTTEHPLLDLSVFQQRPFASGALTILVLYTCESGALYLAIQFTQSMLSYEPLRSGLALLPLPAAIFLVSPRNGAVLERIGPRRTVVAGLGCVAAGLLVSLFWTDRSPYPLLALVLVLVGLGLGLAVAPAASAILHSAPVAKSGIGSAVNNLAKNFGLALGVALNGALLSATYASVIDDAYAGLSPAELARTPDTVYRIVRGSLAGARQTAHQYPGPRTDQVLEVAKAAFLNGQTVAALVGAGLSLICALFVWFGLPNRLPKS